jgi:hypothetical protein
MDQFSLHVSLDQQTAGPTLEMKFCTAYRTDARSTTLHFFEKTKGWDSQMIRIFCNSNDRASVQVCQA